MGFPHEIKLNFLQDSKKAPLSYIWKKRILSLIANYKIIITFFHLFVNQNGVNFQSTLMKILFPYIFRKVSFQGEDEIFSV